MTSSVLPISFNINGGSYPRQYASQNGAEQKYNLASKMPPTNMIYDLKKVMDSRILSSQFQNSTQNTHHNPSQDNSVKIALMNKIRAIEARKKRPVTTNVSLAAESSSRFTKFDSNSNNYQLQLNSDSKIQPKQQQQQTGLAPAPMQASMEINRLRKKFNRSQNENKPNEVFKDRITDQKFFSRNFKLQESTTSNMNTSLTAQNETARTNSYLNTSKMNNDTLNASKTNENATASPTMHNTTSVTAQNVTQNAYNKLKLLKKRNLIKKENSANMSKSQSNLDSMKLEDHRLNSNQFGGTLAGRYTALEHHKSSNTVDESYLYEIKKKDTRASFGKALNITSALTPTLRAKSENYLTENHEDSSKIFKTNMFLSYHENKSNANMSSKKTLNSSNPDLLTTGKSKSKIDIKQSTEKLAKIDNNNTLEPIKNSNNKKTPRNSNTTSEVSENAKAKSTTTTSTKSPTNVNSTLNVNNDIQSGLLVSTQLLSTKAPTTSTNVNEKSEFRIGCPGYTQIIKPNKPVIKGVGGVDFQETETVFDEAINEELKRLFEEDEYFRGVHRKCMEWLQRHVIPNMPRIAAKLKKKLSYD